MQTRDAMPTEATGAAQSLDQQIHVLRERLAFYEGFDRLIQENVAHARELFRLAAHERETASAEVERVLREAGTREAEFRAELASIAVDVGELAKATTALLDRIAQVLESLSESNGGSGSAELEASQAVAVVAHGVPSVGDAMSLQRFVASLPQVAGVTAHEFAGGTLRLDARVGDSLQIAQFQAWEPSRKIAALTERADVIEFAVGDDSG